MDGTPANAPVQVTRLNPLPDRYQAEAQEMLITAFDTDDLSNRTIILDADQNNVNMRELHDQLYPAPTGTESPALTVTCIIESGVYVGSERPLDATPLRAFDVGDWPAGVTLNLIVNGEINGHGGKGGTGGNQGGSAATAGHQGGTALYSRATINVTNNGAIRGGGGGGGGGGAVQMGDGHSGGGGGGGEGRKPGLGGPPGTAFHDGTPGNTGIPEGDGAGGNDSRGDTPSTGGGGQGGPFGQPGSSGQPGPIFTTGGAAGPAGVGIDGISFITLTGSGTVQGSQIN